MAGSPVFSTNFTNRLIPAKPKYLMSIENSQAILKYFIDLKSETSVNQTLDLRSIKHFRIAWLFLIDWLVKFIAFSRNERTHPNLVSQASQAREIEIFCGLQIGRPCRFLQGLWASFSCPSVTPCLLSFVASFVVFDFLGVSLKLTGF